MAATFHPVATQFDYRIYRSTSASTVHAAFVPRTLHPLNLERRSSQAGASTSGRESSGGVNGRCFCIAAAATSGAAADVETAASTSQAARSASLANGSGKKKTFDLVALSNLCVDIVVRTEELPPADEVSRKALLKQLTDNPPPQSAWEVGGNTNTLIAASRLGLSVASVGHTGKDVYGKFLSDILMVRIN